MSAKAPRGAAKLDATSRRLVLALSTDGRRSAAALAKQLGLSRQAVAERIRDLERRGVIRGYRADVDPAALGLEVQAHIRLSLDGSKGPDKEKDVLAPPARQRPRAGGLPGERRGLLRGPRRGRRIEDINTLLAGLQATRAVHASRTAFVLETVLEKGAFGPVEGLLVPEA
jgi:DNA-binding Lrp family transcriptional regulator